jgi:Proteasome maturation factor UMP1
MTSSETIPVMKQPVSMMETGANGTNLASAATARHPVDLLQRQTVGMHPYRNIGFARHVYGSGLAMVLATEQKIANDERQQNQLIGLYRGGAASGYNSVYGDIVTGQDVNIEFTDYLSMPEYQPDLPKQSPHSNMERALGM